MDLKSQDAAKPGIIHAIYSLEKGELKICMGSNFTPDEPEKRPKEFATAAGSENRGGKGKLMFTFKREKK